MSLLDRLRSAVSSPKADSVPARSPIATTGYMREGRTGFLNMRSAYTRDLKHDIHFAADRAFSLAFDFMQNSGWVAGAVDQIIADIVGIELKLNARPDLKGLGYTDKQRADWIRLVQEEWRRWSWNPLECDLQGKATVSEMLDGCIRYYLARGEAIAVFSYLSLRDRQRLGIQTGTKVSIVSPHRLTTHTSLTEGWEQGIYHNPMGRAEVYRFKRANAGIEEDYDIRVLDGAGRPQISHVMDRGATPNSPRGISPMTPAFRVIAQSDQLADATLTTALLQTAFAATITSPEPSADAFQALQQLSDLDDPDPEGVFYGADEIAQDLVSVYGQRLMALKEKTLSIGGDSSQVNHLGPGEKLELHGSVTPGPQYGPFQQGLLREFARCLGITYSALTMNYEAASYSSVRMEGATVWPTITRRRERIAAPMAQSIYEAWLDEMIGTGKIPFRGGYAAFAANRQRVVDTEWRGPSRPSADPYKDALAYKAQLEAGTITLQEIWAERGLDWEAGLDQIGIEVKRLAEIGVPSPFGRKTGGDGAGPLGAAADGQREPARAD